MIIDFVNNEISSLILLAGLLPLAAGLMLLFFPDRFRIFKGIFSLLIASISLCAAYFLFRNIHQPVGTNLLDCLKNNGSDTISASGNVKLFFSLYVDNLSALVMLFISVFTFLVLIYTLAYTQKHKRLPQFFPLVLLTLGASALAVLSDNMILFIVFWGFLGLTLYKIISPDDELSSAAAKKTLILVGASDGLMILGMAIIWTTSGKIDMSAMELPTDNALGITAFICMTIGAFTKAGAFPFHTWIPDYTEAAPAPASAYLPASLDKLLGIYFLSRICNEIFILNDWLRLIILILGVTTIIIAVMMALIQHNYKKLLGYHAVSQVGYMVTGIGLGSVLGIVGGLFHMINHALYKSGLFLVAGSIKKQTDQDKLEKLGGLSRQMPLTFFSALIFALSISGIPPLNGFASKWLIYQGIIDFGHGESIASRLWIVWLALAVIGSALTLASFIKFISGVFLGRQRPELKKAREVSWLMWLPQIILALTCIGFGVFASGWVIPGLFTPIVGKVKFIGFWNSSAISLLILISFILGVLIYLIFSISRFRTDDSFLGGETKREEAGFSPTEFYETIRNFGLFKPVYKAAEKKWFDIYDISKGFVLKVSHFFSAAHDGILSNLAFWVLAGLIFMFIFLLL
jgi:formate hydrogenlyase subunit 3/multisubunit Na+/H+ antiporter MnhD subunit